MTTFRWNKIDGTQRADHSRLLITDGCYFLGEYNSGDGYENKTPQAINRSIHNIKKLPTVPANQLRYRNKSINWFASTINFKDANTWTWVPIPPSKHISDSNYNPKMMDILKSAGQGKGWDVRELVTQTRSTQTSHQSGENRVGLEELNEVYDLNLALCSPEPSRIIILDDVLTAGTHFRAISDILENKFPEAKIMGMFFARTIHKSPFDEWFELG